MIDLNHSTKPMESIHVHFLNVRRRYEYCIVGPPNVEAGTVNPRLALRSMCFQTKFISRVEENLIPITNMLAASVVTFV